jgi:hypothetical protein
MAKSKQAPEIAVAFEFQLERALFLLAQSPDEGCVVGVETDDDVSIRSAEDSHDEQLKHSIAMRGHPFQDRSVGLWKALARWLKESREDPRKYEAPLVLLTNRAVPAVCFVRRLASAQSSDEAESCIRQLREIAESAPKTIKEFTNPLEQCSNSELAQLILRISLLDSENVDMENQRRKIAAFLHLPDWVNADSVVQNLRGWFTDSMVDLWRRRLPGWISRKSFDNQYHAILDERKRERKRERAQDFVPVALSEKESAKSSPFVARLVEIDLDDQEIDHAIDAFLRHSTENFRLAQLGEYTEGDWGEFYGHLRERWSAINLRVRRTARSLNWNAVEHGQKVFNDTTDPDFRGKLAGQETTHLYFTIGGYHRLANLSQVWWFPNYGQNSLGSEPGGE